MKSLWLSLRQARANICAGLLAASILLLGALALPAQQTEEKRVTERRTMTDESGQTHKTSSVIETTVEEVLPPVYNIIHTGPIRLAWMYNINYVRALSNSFALGGGVEFPTSHNSDQTEGFGIVAEARFYPGSIALRGFYIAGGLNFHRFSKECYDYIPNPDPMAPPQTIIERVSFTPLSLGITTGWVLFVWKDLAIDLGLGVKHHLISAEYRNRYGYNEGVGNVGPDVFAGTVPTVRVNIGYAW